MRTRPDWHIGAIPLHPRPPRTGCTAAAERLENARCCCYTTIFYLFCNVRCPFFSHVVTLAFLSHLVVTASATGNTFLPQHRHLGENNGFPIQKRTRFGVRPRGPRCGQSVMGLLQYHGGLIKTEAVCRTYWTSFDRCNG